MEQSQIYVKLLYTSPHPETIRPILSIHPSIAPRCKIHLSWYFFTRQIQGSWSWSLKCVGRTYFTATLLVSVVFKILWNPHFRSDSRKYLPTKIWGDPWPVQGSSVQHLLTLAPQLIIWDPHTCHLRKKLLVLGQAYVEAARTKSWPSFPLVLMRSESSLIIWARLKLNQKIQTWNLENEIDISNSPVLFGNKNIFTAYTSMTKKTREPILVSQLIIYQGRIFTVESGLFELLEHPISL